MTIPSATAIPISATHVAPTAAVPAVASLPTNSEEDPPIVYLGEEEFKKVDAEARPSAAVESIIVPQQQQQQPIPSAPAAYNSGTMVMLPSSNDISYDHTRRGHDVCGCCCDSRRAVIIMNILAVLFAIAGLTGVILDVTLGEADLFDDEDISNNTDDGNTQGEDVSIAALIAAGVILGLLIVCALFGIIGAVRFSLCGVSVAMIYYLVALVTNVLFFSFFGIIFSGIWVYPHIVFFHEMRSNIMTRERYQWEAQSCCCM